MSMQWVEPPSMAELNAELTKVKFKLLCHMIEDAMKASVKNYADKHLYQSRYSKLTGVVMLWIRNETFTRSDKSRLKSFCTTFCKEPTVPSTILVHYKKELAQQNRRLAAAAWRVWWLTAPQPKPIRFIHEFTGPHARLWSSHSHSFTSSKKEVVAFIDIADQLCHAMARSTEEEKQ
jgi:hypothetical protein